MENFRLEEANDGFFQILSVHFAPRSLEGRKL